MPTLVLLDMVGRFDIPDTRRAVRQHNHDRGVDEARGIALNALFPPQPRVPSDMLDLLGRLDRVTS